MGFWRKAGKLAMQAGGVVLEEGKKSIERSKQYKEEMPGKSDNELFKIIQKERSSSPMKAGAAKQELESRGYSADEIKNYVSS